MYPDRNCSSTVDLSVAADRSSAPRSAYPHCFLISSSFSYAEFSIVSFTVFIGLTRLLQPTAVGASVTFHTSARRWLSARVGRLADWARLTGWHVVGDRFSVVATRPVSIRIDDLPGLAPQLAPFFYRQIVHSLIGFAYCFIYLAASPPLNESANHSIQTNRRSALGSCACFNVVIGLARHGSCQRRSLMSVLGCLRFHTSTDGDPLPHSKQATCGRVCISDDGAF